MSLLFLEPEKLMYNNRMLFGAISKTRTPYKTLKTNRGFTLMEVMVAVSIFTIVVVVGIGSLLTINSNYRKSQTDRKSIDSLSYVLESMSRRIRTATSWDMTTTGTPITSFSFVDQDGISVRYFTQLGQTNETAVMVEIVNGPCPILGGSCPLPNVPDGTYTLTPVGVDIGGSAPGTGLWFTIENPPNAQPYVRINMGGTVKNARQVTDFFLQTGISKRTF